MAVKVLEVCMVAPPPDSPTNASLNLTFFDLFWLRAPPVELLFFYEAREPLVSASTLVPSLKRSLSLTLKHFLPLAGNLTWPLSSPKPIIRYEKGDGISFIIVQSDDDFFHLSGKNLRESRIFHPLVARIAGSESRSPLFAVKVTIFPNKGFCIGITQHHAAGDGKTFSVFFKYWASITKFGESGSLSKELTPVFDRESVRERYAELENLYIEVLRKQNENKLAVWELESPDLVRATFVLSDLEISDLKDLASAHVANYERNEEVTQAPYISNFTVMYAYVILCLVKAKTRTNNIVLVSFISDCRARLAPPLSANYIGNCVRPCDMYFNIKELLRKDGKDGLMAIVNAISTSIKDLDNNGALRGAKEWLTDMIKQFADTELWMISIAGSTRYELQNIDFGWGRPRKADITSIDKTGAVTFTEVGDGSGKGFEVELSLSKGEMEKFASIFALGLGKTMKRKVAAL